VSIERQQVILSWSGGKDSSLALACLRADPRYEVVALLTSITRSYERVSIHGVRRTLLESQAEAIGLPILEIPLDPACSNTAYEEAFVAALTDARRRFPSARQIAFGDLFLVDVRAYREKLLAATDYEPCFPLWGRDTHELAHEFVAAGYGARLVCVDTTQLSADFAGRAFDAAFLAELPQSVDPCGERGEFHTFLWRGPVFRAEIPIMIGDVVLRENRFAYCDLVAGQQTHK
jgi:uncharacterized protein (TIGR00290 family)